MQPITSTAGGFEKVVFESVKDTLAGGAAVDVTGFTNSDNIIPAGTAIGPKNTTTGLYPIVTHSSGTLSGAVLGYVHRDVQLATAGNNWVGVVLEGVMRKAAIPVYYTSAAITNLKTATPKVTIVD
jgi:hypothetical protein